MSSKTQVTLQASILIMVLAIGIISITTSFRNSDDIAEQKRLTIEGRQIGNQRGNLTLGAVGMAIHEIKDTERNILSNLTAHRMVTNYTRDDILLPLANKTNELIIQLNSTNEQGRGKAVQEIIQAVNNNTALLEQLLSSHNNKG